ncbi:hypothetical protein B0T20DRAFT_427615 [Sordaria brevicollis]|uniref:Uncharacterized protein n=1 Tax=Sordaria brevicollis TaxID=83679 RepID=A0AAE0U096_SORBR|nr:hypothetical protein B0T20DRAFT_427615 [Sordaria brevicollis]
MDSAWEGLLSGGTYTQQQQRENNLSGYPEEGTPIQTPPPLYASSFIQTDTPDGARSNQQHDYRSPVGRPSRINFAGWQPLSDGEDYGGQGQQGKESGSWEKGSPSDFRTAQNKNRPDAGVYNVSKLRPWSSLWNIKHWPWKSVIPLTLCFASIIACYYTAYKADNVPVEDWSFPVVGNFVEQPSAILSFFSTMTNSLMLLGFTNAWVTMFWLKAMKPGGVPITDLHYHTQGAMGLTGALTALFKGRSVAISLVCILIAASSTARGPLIQRAVSVQTFEVSINGTMDLPIMRGVTDGWGGRFNEHSGGDMAYFDDGFSQAIRDFQAKTPIHIPGLTQPCENCTFTVTGFGFDIMNCTEHTTPYHIYEQWNLGPEFYKKDKRALFYSVNLTRRWLRDPNNYRAPSVIELATLRKTDPDCKGETTTRVCWLDPSKVEYKLFMAKESNVTFQSSNWKSDVVLGNNTLNSPFRNETNTLLPLLDFIQPLFEARAMLDEGVGDHDMEYSGLGGYLYHRGPEPGTKRCWGTWDDPLDDIMNSFRDLGLRMSIYEAIDRLKEVEDLRAIGNVTDADTLLDKVMQRDVAFVSNHSSLRYAIDYGKLWLGLGVSAIGPLATLILLAWQWWGRAMFSGSPGLGRTFSMSPLEIANAFFGGGVVPTAGTTMMSTSYKSGSGSENSKADSSLTVVEEVDGGGGHRPQQQHTLAPVLAGCSSNSSASQIVKHIRQRTVAMNGKGGLVRNKEPRVQYGVDQSSGRLAFVIIERGEEPETVVRRPRRAEML